MPERKPPIEPRQSLRPSTSSAGVPGAPFDAIAAAKKVPFFDPEGARQTLSRVVSRLSPGLASAIPALLAESPDPDSALLLFERLLSESGEEVVRLLNRHHFLAHYAIVVFGHSRFLGETLIQNTDLLQTFLREKDLDRSFSREEFHEGLARFRSRSFETDVALLLARFKRREYVRILLRDVLKLAPLAETTAEISALADVLIEDALRESDSLLQRRYGSPQNLDIEGRFAETPFAVLSLGKLGGNELNYSSDVDLMYIFGDGQEPPGAAISNREYFIRLAQQVTAVLSRVTREGPVFRIDMRLRPQGGEGELAISLSHALDYYARAAHDWERQALIKVRYSAGDATLAREFLRGVQRYVYTEQVNFPAIETALEARERMQTRRRISKLQHLEQTIDAKTDRGGIRDIEFLVQCLQRVYGGAEPWLRSGGTLFSLQKLHDKRHISGKEFHDLNSAYEFLRHLEHRLQLRHGQQTHRLPLSEREMRILQKSLEGYLRGQEPGDLRSLVVQRMASVADIYKAIIHHQQVRSHLESPTGEFELRSSVEPVSIDQSYQQVLERLAGDSPELYRFASRRDLSPQARRNLFRFLSSAFTSSERYAAVLRHPQALEKAGSLFETSEYLTDILIRHPEEIETLSQSGGRPSHVGGGFLFQNPLAPPGRLGDPVFDYLAHSSLSYSEKLAVLRQHCRHRVFAVGARDISELRGIYESFAETTAVAEDVIAAAFGIAGSPEGFAVMALGRLGTAEFDVLSDADLLFVCEEGKNGPDLTKAAEQIMQALAAYTREGMVFAVDARLRPRGAEGELLVTPLQLQTYFEQEAQPWEALMYTKLRFLVGSQSVGKQACAATSALFERFAADSGFLRAVREMRGKLENVDPGARSLKASPGAIYDIDFLAGYLLVKHGIPQRGTLRERLWRCVGAGKLQKSDAAALDHCAELFRTVEHAGRLVVGRALKWLPGTAHARQVAEALTSKILGTTWRDGLEAELLETCHQVRSIYDRVIC